MSERARKISWLWLLLQSWRGGGSLPEFLLKKGLCVYASLLSHVKLFMVSWTEANQGPLPMEFYRQEYWSGLPSPTPGNIPDLGI